MTIHAHWEIVPPTPDFIGPPAPLACEAGWTSHTYTLLIQDGAMSLSTDECPACNRGIQDLEWEYLQGEFPVRLTFNKETHGYYNPEIDVWWEIEPA